MTLFIVLVLLMLLNVKGYIPIISNSRYNIQHKALNNDNIDSNTNNQGPISIRSSISKPLALGLGWLTIAGGVIGSNMLTTTIAKAKTGDRFPVIGSNDLMKPKAHGTSEFPVQDKLRWNCDVKLADRICNYNRNWAEYAGYWNSETSFLISVYLSSEKLTVFSSILLQQTIICLTPRVKARRACSRV